MKNRPKDEKSPNLVTLFAREGEAYFGRK
jgi:hypothetical protein